ncbi:LysR family transcriptional regulator [Pseudohoeflea coraliihabitans]|uniref:LysR family transcriptional regulator n=1 Tax=Pseudohoeflea coraliihabitans TaxID=2860393 RepID=A0ABS6WRZ4_9HYPH|nr:LysR family transcriptional regulator [Pseudohoeflea sp. DP4N28-3]MBW3098736.1 LysR family transcriptional regulator [Pseudohoeflea sp. DP4N28-3]
MSEAAIGWELWRSFLAVMNERSLSGAARSLSVSQPTIGRHVDQLETALGVRLFTRAQNGLTPTDLAISLEPQARSMATAAEVLARSVAQTADSEAGIVRLSATEIMSTEILPALLAPFLRQHEGLEIEVDASNRNVDLLRREADIAIRMQRPEQGALLARRVGVVRLGLYASRDYLGNRAPPGSIAELAGHRVIGPDRDPLYRSRFASELPDITPSLFSYRSDSHNAQLAAVRAGVGIGVSHKSMAERDPSLVPVLADTVHFEMETWLSMHEDLRHNHRIKMVYDHLFAHLPSFLD